MKIKNFFPMILILILLLISSGGFINQAQSALTLAPNAEGTLVKTHYILYYPKYTYTTTYGGTTIYGGGTTQGGGSHVATGLPNVQVFRTYNATATMGGGFKVTDYLNQGIIEFDISSLSGYMPGTYTAELILNLNDVFGFITPGTLSLWDLSTASEDGMVTTGESRSGFVTDLFSGPPYPSGPMTLTIDVTSLIETEILSLNLSGNAFSGFLMDWGLEPTVFPLYQQTSEADFDFGSQLKITTEAVPEPVTLLLLGGGLVGIYLFRRRS